MRKLAQRALNIILRPDSEWAAIAHEQSTWISVCARYVVPLASIAPLAYGARMLIGGDGAFRTFAGIEAALPQALLSAWGAFAGSLLSVLVIAPLVFLLAPLYRGRRSFADAFRVVAYAGTPVWLAGCILIAPLNRFPLLVIVILIAIMHALFLFYLGLSAVVQVPRRDAAECTAVIAFAGLILSTVVGYYASAAGLFPHM
jgi:hypothetical protein